MPGSFNLTTIKRAPRATRESQSPLALSAAPSNSMQRCLPFGYNAFSFVQEIVERVLAAGSATALARMGRCENEI